jgi:MFS family permease
MGRLPFSRFHWLVITALGITWILDGLEVTIVGSIGPVLQDKDTLALTVEQVGIAASCYVVGAVGGALGFGWLTDRFGRRRIFNITLGIYLFGVLLTALSWGAWSFALFRAVTGIGIGGRYASVNSAVDELIPARLRGRIDMAVNGSYWFGAAVGAAGSLLLLNGTPRTPEPGLADRFRDWRRSRLGCHFPATLRTGESTMAHHAWPGARGAPHHWTN